MFGELTFRHWSNGGIRLPNHGQDFVTLTVRLNSGLVGVDRTDQIAADGATHFKALNVADNAVAGSLP